MITEYDSLTILYHINPHITKEDIAYYEAIACNDAELRQLIELAEDGDSAAEDRLRAIILYGTTASLYWQIWNTSNDDEEIMAIKDQAACDLLHRAADRDLFSRVKADCLILFVCYVHALSCRGRMTYSARTCPEVCDIANELYALYLQQFTRILSSRQPKHYLLQVIQNKCSKLIMTEHTTLGIYENASRRTRERCQLLKNTVVLSNKETGYSRLKELQTGNYEDDYTILQLYFQLTKTALSIDSPQNASFGECTLGDLIADPCSEDGYLRAEERLMRCSLLRRLSDPLMRIIIEETYLSPESQTLKFNKTGTRRRAQAMLEECFGIDEDLYHEELGIAERLLADILQKTG